MDEMHLLGYEPSETLWIPGVVAEPLSGHVTHLILDRG